MNQQAPYYFAAGPAALPKSILVEVQNELLDWNNTGLSILELGHRTPAFRDLLEDTESRLRKVLHLAPHYHILFLGGNTRSLFSLIAMNFLRSHEKAAYLITGTWSEMAFKEAQRFYPVYCAESASSSQFTAIPAQSTWALHKETCYFYYTPNETIHGIYCHKPQLSIPLIADMTSCLLMEPLESNNYAMIFAGAQKNIANAGLQIAIIHDDFLKRIDPKLLPTAFNFQTHVNAKSLYATPPTFNCYLANKMLKWVEKQGGVNTLYLRNQQKAAILYNAIDQSNFYYCSIQQPYRSYINVCFRMHRTELEALFLQEAKENQLLSLAGHSLIGGLRASLYNAMPIEGVEHLIAFMQNFAEQHQ